MFWTWKRKRTLKQVYHHLDYARGYLCQLEIKGKDAEGSSEELAFLQEEQRKIKHRMNALKDKFLTI